MYLLQSSQKVQSSVQTKEQESGSVWPKQDTEACQVPWFSHPKDGADFQEFQIQTSLQGAGIVLLPVLSLLGSIWNHLANC